jgi:hypothetical protein
MPLRFRRQVDANSVLEASGLFTTGARAIEDEFGRWHIVIDARIAAPMRAHLRCQTPGILWLEEDTPTP